MAPGSIRYGYEDGPRMVKHKGPKKGTKATNNVTGSVEEFMKFYREGKRDFSGADPEVSRFSIAIGGQDLEPYIEEINERYDPKKPLNLSKCIIRGLNAPGLKIPRAHLFYTKMIRSNLRYSDLRGTHMVGTDLTWSDLSGSDLRGAYFGNTIVTNANLTGAVFNSENGLIGLEEAAFTEEAWQEMKDKIGIGKNLEKKHR